MRNAYITYRVQIEVIKCNMEVAMETRGSAKFDLTKSKMADSQFALSYEIVVNQLKQNANNKNTTKST